ncbi:MAG: hypothetical protein L0Z50_42690 [Verrucomicrobiales bacterium]|nr:hypothetical protein [Verrucomicrobiales bacterium]
MNSHTGQQVFERIDATQLNDLKRDLFRAAQRYTAMRIEWRLANPDERHQLDAGRTRAHDSLIDSFKILSREQAKRGEDNSWRKLLGDDRKEIGDTAGYLVLFLALSAR